jgi:small subunit ribosomal protein S1
MSWTKQVKNPADLFKKGQSVDVVVIAIDKENRRIKLGLKQLQDNPWISLKKKHPKGSIVTGTVTSIVDFGVFVRVDEDIEGLIHISQLSNERIEDPNSVCKVGDEMKAAVIDIDENKKKVTLSVREYLNHLEEKEIHKYLDHDGADTNSMPLGNLIDMTKIGE